jgi:glycosyltransferase involved in cell wall biosynthesis
VKIAQVINEFPPPLVGGGSYHVQNLSKELAERGEEVTVFTCKTGGSLLQKKIPAEIQFKRIRVYRVPAIKISGTSYWVAPQLLSALLKENPDIIHAHGYQLFTSDVAAIVSRIKRKPLVLTLHGFPRGFSRFSHRVYFSLVGKKTLRAAKRIISVSKTMKREFEAIGVSSKKMVTIPNGIDLKVFQRMPNGTYFRKRLDIGDNDKMILSMGRLERVKGFQYLIEALSKIQSVVGPTKLVLAGPESDYGQHLRILVKEKKLTEDVIFYGSIGEREKLEALAAANVVVMSSIYEGFSVFLLEAMAAQKPVVATRTGIAPEIIQDGENGLLASPADAEDLCNKVTQLLNDKKLSSSVSRKSKNAVRVFDWKKIAEQVSAIYRQCLKEP